MGDVMNTEGVMYVVLVKRGWDALELKSPNVPFPISMLPPDDPDEPIGFLPVFDTHERATKYAASLNSIPSVLAIRPIEEGDNGTHH
jgi:hypothetical protein